MLLPSCKASPHAGTAAPRCSSRSALAALDQATTAAEPFALVVVDAHLSETDGFALAKQIQQVPELAATRILLLTSAGQPRDVARCRELGIDAHVMKPVKQSELLDVILTALHSSMQHAERPAPASLPSPRGA